jgi:hypothetical protein
MKKMFTCAALLLAITTMFAQQRPVQTLRLRNDSLPYYRKQPATTIAPKPPAVQLYGLEVTAVASGPGTYTLTIAYGVRNDSTAAVTLDKLSLQGYVVNQNDVAKPLTNLLAYRAACGAAAGISTEVLQPGGRTKAVFKCFNISLNPANNPVYALTLKVLRDPREQNVPFSRMDIPIRVQ